MWSEILASLSCETPSSSGRRVPRRLRLRRAGFAFGIVAPRSGCTRSSDPCHVPVVSGGRIIHAAPSGRSAAPSTAHRLWPFLLAGLIGVPIGVWLLVRTDAGTLKFALGIFLPSMGSTRCRAAAAADHGGRAPTQRSASSAVFWAALAAIPACCRRSGPSCAAGRRTNRARLYQPFILDRAYDYAAAARHRGARPRRAGTVPLALPALALAPGSAGISTAGSTRRRFRQVLAAHAAVSGVGLVF